MATASADGIPYLVPLSFDWDGEALLLATPAASPTGDRFAARYGFDPRTRTTENRWYRVAPRRIQAWRAADELPERELMRDGCWSTELA